MKKLGFGFMRLPLTDPEDNTSVDLEQVKRMVDAFLARGFCYFDTAYTYHKFQSEIILRETLVKRHPRDSFTVASKLPVHMLKTADDQTRIFNEQLEKCGVTYFDYYLLHAMRFSNYEITKKLDTFAFIQQKKAEGMIRKIGFSYHDTPELLDQILQEHPEVEFVQLQINYADWDNEGIQAGMCYEVACKHGIPVIVMEPVKGGTLAKAPAAAEKILKQADPTMSIASWAIRYAASLPNVMMVLSGMSTYKQILDNTAYMQDFKPLNTQEQAVIAQVVDIVNQASVIPCTSCQYCVAGCPKQIAIPKYFTLYNTEKNYPPNGFSSQQSYYMMLTRTHGKASDCIACRRCEDVCPQHIEITKWLKEIAQLFEV